ncbi:MAG: bifunctional transaldolase/phosoglucose isomerase, partial [Anaerolineae bacterium]|nr:bifunctional transaldolase/phosoglucose isomerase [Anaerolineae bacterium]
IQHALDLFLPIYERTGGRDGYVSLEVSPLIANDTQSTIAEAQRLFNTVNRPNTMIKIPATKAGIPAIEESIAAGINVNVTLIFAVKNYLEVAEAYIRGLERRMEAGEDVSQVASVASFFLSRIDTMVDHMLENNIRAASGRDLDRVSANRRLLGKAAIANAKLAYKRFMELFYGERFEKLQKAGAQVQRPLWASTSTKNPAYSDTMYIDKLIGQDTVNTVPPATLKAFKDHGTVKSTLTENMDDATEVLDMLAEVGVDLDQITHQLQVDGVEAFSDAFQDLLDQVDAKRNVLRTGVMRQYDAVLGIYGDAVREAVSDMDRDFVNMRIWDKDGSAWKNHNLIINQIQNRLGWLDVANTIDYARLKALQEGAKHWEHVVLLGMGGSSLAPEVFSLAFGAQPGFPHLHVLDNTSPEVVCAVEAAINLEKTLFLVSSKSGGTIETLSFFHYFYERTGQNGAQFIAITDPDSPLEQLAAEKHFREVYRNPADIGGRYSALSYFGLVPAALLGVDLDALRASADRMMMACAPSVKASYHPGILLGAAMGVLTKEGRDKVSIYCSPSISSFSNWAEQLIAESTGKEGRGLVPVVGATIGNPHDFVTDRLFIYLRVEGDDNEELDQGMQALQQAGQPCITIQLDDRYALGGEFFRWEYATAVAGKVLNINPFDEPNVTESKENTARLLEYYAEHGELPETEAALSEQDVSLYADEKMIRLLSELSLQHHYSGSDLAGMLAAQINATRAGDYFAVLAYLPPTPEIEEALHHIRRRLRHTTRRAVTSGYGPRYLHSTGQLHKGGADNGVYFIITADVENDLDIPGAPYSFGTLQSAQAMGDFQALVEHGRRVLRLHLRGNRAAGLQKFLVAIDAVDEKRH